MMMNFDFPQSFVALPHLGIIQVQGKDALSFLHGQLTNDLIHLDAHYAQLNAYCSVKGRVLATFINWTQQETIYLITSKSLFPYLLKRLGMFILRAQVKINVSDLQLAGCIGNTVNALLGKDFTSSSTAIWQKIIIENNTIIRIPDAQEQARWVIIGSAEQMNALPIQEDAKQIWPWLDIQAALPWIAEQTQDKLLPQTLNLDALGGVHFKKGCYPGQEVVARTQYLGKIKRRMLRAHYVGTALAEPGSDVYSNNEPIGSVINAAANPMGGYDLLIELPWLDKAQNLTVLDQPLSILDLPYALPEQDLFIRPKL